MIKVNKVCFPHAIGNLIGCIAGIFDSVIGIISLGFLHGSFQFKWGLFRLGTGFLYNNKNK